MVNDLVFLKLDGFQFIQDIDHEFLIMLVVPIVVSVLYISNHLFFPFENKEISVFDQECAEQVCRINSDLHCRRDLRIQLVVFRCNDCHVAVIFPLELKEVFDLVHKSFVDACAMVESLQKAKEFR